MDQIRAYTVQVSIPGVPTYVVALLPSSGKETAEELATLHSKVLEVAEECGLKTLSIGADGAAPEILAQTTLTSMASQFLHFDDDKTHTHIKIPMFGRNRDQ